MKPCQHLDYTEGKFTDCELRSLAPHYPNVRYWFRGATWTDNGDGTTNTAKVQFCKLRGRINGILGCYDGAMPCYAPAPGEETR